MDGNTEQIDIALLHACIGSTLTEIRYDRGESLTTVSRKLNQSRWWLSVRERGARHLSISDYIRWCDALGVDWLAVLDTAMEQYAVAMARRRFTEHCPHNR